ncbi:Patatin [Leptothrix cholodnii SP-6]|uniref:Patatin n=1 Tax=Leptothrix cholodnii (strain ATCC 51168 / LMG 8142 / SP-6) TaxID=395495 RepID=B1XW50_LEPCP|nr:patatin-like phospholipase family protein [Leptothrix cholodnii]ACB32577.1 Patatin [Leptothrix cholodnii SP-6]
MHRRSLLSLAAVALLLTACASAPPVAVKPPPLPRIGLALGGGAAKGFAHVGVIKVLEAAGLTPTVVAGTSAGSVVGALYASGLSGFALQEQSFALDEERIKDLTLFGVGGVIKGDKLQAYVNELIKNKPLEQMSKPFAAVATDLDSGERVIFTRGNTGQAVRASCSVPGVFQPALIGGKRYVDGGLVSPVPVDAARQLGADIVIAVDISSKARDGKAAGMLSNLNQTITIMGQKLGEQEMTRAEVVIRPRVGQIGATDLDQKHVAVLEGEKAAQAALPQIRAAIERWQQAQLARDAATAVRR